MDIDQDTEELDQFMDQSMDQSIDFFPDSSDCLFNDTDPCLTRQQTEIRTVGGQWQSINEELSEEWGSIERVQLSDDRGDAGAEVSLRTLTFTIPPRSSSFSISWSGLAADRLLQLGHQSWSFSGAVTVPDAVPQDESGHLLATEGVTGDSYFAEHGVSYSAIGGRIGPEFDEEGLLISNRSSVWLVGALNSSYAFTVFAAERNAETAPEEEQIRLMLRVGLGDVSLGGESLNTLLQSSEPQPVDEEAVQVELLWVNAPTMWHALRAYRDKLKSHLVRRLDEERGANLNSGTRIIPRDPPRGWFSWNEHFEEITPDIIVANLIKVSEALTDFGFTLVEIDDGWQSGWGNWTLNERFQDGQFEIIATEASRNNLNFGIWMAPFLVEVDVAQRMNQDYFVTQNGMPIEHRIVGNPRTYYVIDTTAPGSMDHVRETISLLIRRYGVAFFKLDFLYAASLPGDRHREATGSEALQYGLSLIREVMNENTILNACGAPVHAILGQADSLRVGADTTFGALLPAFIASAARNLAARAYLFPLVWPDGDQVQLREPYTVNEAITGAWVAALGGRAYSFGDDLALLPEQRLSLGLTPELLTWVNAPAPSRPVDLMTKPADRIYVNPLAEAAQQPGGTPAVPPSIFEVIDTSGQRRRVRFSWESNAFNAQEEVVTPSE